MKLTKYILITVALIFLFQGSVAQCPISASFIDSSAGLTTTFISTSTGTSTSSLYLWRFGDGDTSTIQNPVHSYLSSGNYSVKLEVTDTAGVGCFDSITSVIIVPGNGTTCLLSASFTQSSSGLTASFVNTSTGITSTPFYMWSFGDATPSVTTVNPTHTYANAGTYNVDLIVSDSSGCIDTAYSTIVVAPLPCPITSTFTETISGLSVALNVTSVSGLSGPGLYSWTFGDGTGGTGQSTAHTYTSQGLYKVALTVADSTCAIDVSKYISVSSNVFTPNGDGIDDVFVLPCSGSAATVYNTNGILIKTLAPNTTSWDGSNNLGGNEPTGLYFVLCSSSSAPVPVTLIR